MEDAKARKRREIEERRARLEKQRSAKATRQKETEEKLRAKKAEKERQVRNILNQQEALSPIASGASQAQREKDRAEPLEVVDANTIKTVEIDDPPIPPALPAPLDPPAPTMSATAKTVDTSTASFPVTSTSLFQSQPKLFTYCQSTQTEIDEISWLDNKDGTLINSNEQDKTASSSQPDKDIAAQHPDIESAQSNDDVAEMEGDREPEAEISANNGGSSKTQEEDAEKPEISDEFRKEIMDSTTFRAFVNGKARVVERALGESRLFDCTNEYLGMYTENANKTQSTKKDDVEDENIPPEWRAAKHLIRPHLCFKPSGESFRPLKNGADLKRPVCDIDWAPHHPELIAVAYGAALNFDEDIDGFGESRAKKSSRTNPNLHSDGVVLLWSLVTPDKPEMRLSCHSPVLSVQFQESNPALVFGGTFSGQLVVWDTRTRSSLPERRSGMSTKCHAHPVYSMVQRSNASRLALQASLNGQSTDTFGYTVDDPDHFTTLVTAATDGTVCEWNMDNIFEPINRLQLRFDASTRQLGRNPGSPKSKGGGIHAQCGVSISTLALVGQDVGSSFSSLNPEGNRRQSDYLCMGTETGDMFLAELGETYRSNGHIDQSGLLPPSQRVAGSHLGLITGMSLHPANDFKLAQKRAFLSERNGEYGNFASSYSGQHDSRANRYRHLLLTTGMDWTTRLWSLSLPSEGEEKRRGINDSQSDTFVQGKVVGGLFNKGPALCEFHGEYECVCDVEWSPQHPAVFATVNGTGHLSLWDLTVSLDKPKLPPLPVTNAFESLGAKPTVEDSVEKTTQKDDGSPDQNSTDNQSGQSSVPLNKLKWSRDGNFIATGDTDGTVKIFSVRKELNEPKEGTEDLFERFLAKCGVLD